MAKRQRTEDNEQPQDLADKGAELALLGCMLLDISYALDAMNGAGVTADSFFVSDNRRLCEVLLDAHARGEPSDFATVGFGAPELRVLALDAQSATPTVLNAPRYAARVAELAERRRMLAIAAQIAEAAADGNLDAAGAILASAEAPRTKTRRAKTSYTAAELLDAEFPEPVWLVPGLIPTGLVILAGRPKIGKSWMALQVAGAVAGGGKFFNTDTPMHPVLYIPYEDSPLRLKRRLNLQKTTRAASIRFEFDFPSLADDRALLALERLRAEGGHRLIVIDTLTRAMGKVDQNDQVAIGLIVGQLQRWATEHDVCLLIVDHHKKPGPTVDDLVSDVMGATSKTAAADAVIGLYRKRGQRDATLKLTGRDIEERELSVDFDKSIGSWTLRGDADQVVNGEANQAVVDALQVLGQATHRELCEVTNQDRGNVFKRLQEMIARGLVERIEGPPARFTLVKDVTVTFNTGKGEG